MHQRKLALIQQIPCQSGRSQSAQALADRASRVSGQY
jgi:hypothetical protein